MDMSKLPPIDWNRGVPRSDEESWAFNRRSELLAVAQGLYNSRTYESLKLGVGEIDNEVDPAQIKWAVDSAKASGTSSSDSVPDPRDPGRRTSLPRRSRKDPSRRLDGSRQVPCRASSRLAQVSRVRRLPTAVEPHRKGPEARMKPSLGRIVRYRQGVKIEAALIAQVISDTVVNLTVFAKNGSVYGATAISYDDKNEKPNGWFWPRD